MGFADDAYQPFSWVGDAMGMGMDKVNFVTCGLAAYPFALAFRTIPKNQASLRHLVGGLIGLAMSILCFRGETIHLWVHMLYTWAMMRLGGSRQHLFVFWGCMLHLFGVYMYHRTYYWGDYSLNIAGPLMILTQKMTQVAFAVHDGQRDPHIVNAFCRPHVLQKVPSLLEMFGHTFFFPSLLAGPNHHFHVYRDMIEGTGPNSKPVNGLLPGLKKLGVALGIYVITLLPGIIFGTPEIKPHRVVAGPMYNGEPNPVHEYSFTGKLLYNIMAMQFHRCSFYFAWSLVEGACNVSGLGYRGLDDDGNEQWDLITNALPVQVEFATNFKEVIDNWNIQTARWLRYVCYERLGKEWYPTSMTMVLSALWHGPYVGYYMTFFTAALSIVLNRKFRRNVRPHFMPEGSPQHKFYTVAGFVVNLFVLNYIIGPFLVLTVEDSFKFWNYFCWYIHIVYFVLYLVLPSKPKAPKESKKEL